MTNINDESKIEEIINIVDKKYEQNITLIGIIIGFDVILGLEIVSSGELHNNENLIWGTILILLSIVSGIYTILINEIKSMTAHKEYYLQKCASIDIRQNELEKSLLKNTMLSLIVIFTILSFFSAFLTYLLKEISPLVVLIITLIVIFLPLYLMRRKVLNVVEQFNRSFKNINNDESIKEK
jgi:hypothetical protein